MGNFQALAAREAFPLTVVVHKAILALAVVVQTLLAKEARRVLAAAHRKATAVQAWQGCQEKKMEQHPPPPVAVMAGQGRIPV